jgi:hypothetical protein
MTYRYNEYKVQKVYEINISGSLFVMSLLQKIYSASINIEQYYQNSLYLYLGVNREDILECILKKSNLSWINYKMLVYTLPNQPGEFYHLLQYLKVESTNSIKECFSSDGSVLALILNNKDI